MKITNEIFHNISDMVKLSYTEEEEIRLIKDLNQLVEFIDPMNEQNTDNEEPMSYIHSVNNIYREDIEDDINIAKELHANAPNIKNGYYVVPRIQEY